MINLYDQSAEESVLGAMLLRREAVMEAIDIVEASDFYNPSHASIFQAMEDLFAEGTVIDYTTVASKVGGEDIISRLSNMQMNTPSAGTNAVTAYARIVYDKAIARKIFRQIEEAREGIINGDDPYQLSDDLEHALTTMGSAHANEIESVTLDELQATVTDLEDDVIIPGMLNREWRTIIVAPEGMGKSTILRAISITSSQGLHPFSHRDIKPIRVLIVDLENPKEAILETGMELMKYVKMWSKDYDPSRLRIFRRPAGIDLRRAKDRADLRREIGFHKPDLVCIGPVIKMYQKKGGESYEDSADAAMAELDQLRTRYGFALLLEHHAAKGSKGERDMTPFGSQRWMSWPDAGKGLYPNKDDPTRMRVDTFRGDRLRGIAWPDEIIRDKQWLITGRWTNGIPEGIGQPGRQK